MCNACTHPKAGETHVFGRFLPGVSSPNKYLEFALFSKPVFGLAALASNGPVLQMEGPINAMIASSWGFNVVDLKSTNPSPAHLEQVGTRIVNNPRWLVPAIDNDEVGSIAIVKWREFVPQIEEPIMLPTEVNGKLIKDTNALHTIREKGAVIVCQPVEKAPAGLIISPALLIERSVWKISDLHKAPGLIWVGVPPPIIPRRHITIKFFLDIGVQRVGCVNGK